MRSITRRTCDLGLAAISSPQLGQYDSINSGWYGFTFKTENFEGEGGSFAIAKIPS